MRPKKENKRDKEVKIYLTIEEKERLKTLLEESSYRTYSEMLRDILLNNSYEVVHIDPNLIREKAIIITEIKRIGNNFSQLLKLLHSKKLNYFTTKDVNMIKEHLEKLTSFFNKIDRP